MGKVVEVEVHQYRVSLPGFTLCAYRWPDGYLHLGMPKKLVDWNDGLGMRETLAPEDAIPVHLDSWVVEAGSPGEAEAVFKKIMCITSTSRVFRVQDLGPAPEQEEGDPDIESFQARESTRVAQERDLERKNKSNEPRLPAEARGNPRLAELPKRRRRS